MSGTKRIYQSDYWRVQVFALKFMGIWPYTNTLWDKFMRVFVYISLYVLILPEGIKMYQEVGHNTEIVVENVVGQMYLNAAVIKFSSSIIFRKKLKYIYELISNDWENTTDKDEMKIMKEHAANGRKICFFYGICCYSSAAAFLVIPALDPLLDYIIPLENETRHARLPFYAEYYIDQRKYYIPLLIKIYVTGVISMTVFVTYDMAFSMQTQHVCSLFDIVCLRIHKALKIGNSDTPCEEKVYKTIIQAINLHQIAIENVTTLETAYNIVWFFILILNTTAIGGGLLILIWKSRMVKDLVRYGMFFSSIFIHKYFIFLPGQKIINYSLKVFDECYFCEWYNLTPKCKMLLRIIMSRSIRPMNQTGGKMFILCMETYASMLKGGMSYFTLMSSMS